MWSVIAMEGSVMSHRQTKCWRGSRELYIWIGKQQEEGMREGVHDTGSGLSIWNLKAHSPVTHFLPQAHTYSNKDILQ